MVLVVLTVFPSDGAPGPSQMPQDERSESEPESEPEAPVEARERPEGSVCAYCGVCDVFLVSCAGCDAWVHRECAFSAFPHQYPSDAIFDMECPVTCEVCAAEYEPTDMAEDA